MPRRNYYVANRADLTTPPIIAFRYKSLALLSMISKGLPRGCIDIQIFEDRIVISELTDGAFDKYFVGKNGNIHTVDSKYFEVISKPNEFICKEPVVSTKVDEVNDILAALKKCSDVVLIDNQTRVDMAKNYSPPAVESKRSTKKRVDKE